MLRSLWQVCGRRRPLHRNRQLQMRSGNLRRRHGSQQPARISPAIPLWPQERTTSRIPNSTGAPNRPQGPMQPHPARRKPAPTRRRRFRSQRWNVRRLDRHRTARLRKPAPSQHLLPRHNRPLPMPRPPRCALRQRPRRRQQTVRRSWRLRLRQRPRKTPSPRSTEDLRWELLHGPTQEASTPKPVFAIPILDGWAYAPISTPAAFMPLSCRAPRMRLRL
jgi:hypothetical protein